MKNLKYLSVESLHFNYEDAKRLQEQLPDCVINNTHVNCGGQWRHHHRYDTLAHMFSYQLLDKPQAYEPFDNLD
jgi:hypothetical protein